MPIRHGKSELISHWFVVWFLSIHPWASVILTTYESSLSEHWGRRIRDTITEHGDVLGLHLRPDIRSITEFGLVEGGSVLCVGRGGSVTGRGANLFVGDDLIKNFEEANSPTIRESIWQWLDSTAITRLEPGGSAVIVMSRWHEDDPVGRLTKSHSDKWNVINMPALAESDEDVMGRAKGEALWPWRWPVEVLEEIKQERGPLTWNALYQQHPQPLEGGILKYSYFRYYETDHETQTFALNHGDGRTSRHGFKDGYRFGTMDLAISTKTTADFTVTLACQFVDGYLILLDLHRERMEFPEQLDTAERFLKQYDLDWMGVEKVAYQAAFYQAGLRRGLRVKPIEAKADKVTRAVPLEAMMSAGRVFFPYRSRWLSDLADELVHFPTGMHDDQVDALAYAAHAVFRSARPKVKRIEGPKIRSIFKLRLPDKL